jgi:hypothetical protein
MPIVIAPRRSVVMILTGRTVAVIAAAAVITVEVVGVTKGPVLWTTMVVMRPRLLSIVVVVVIRIPKLTVVNRSARLRSIAL